MRVNINELIVLSVPSFVVQIQKIPPILTFDDKFYGCLAPNVFGVAYVDHVSRLNRKQSMTMNILMVLQHSLLPSDEFLIPLLWRMKFDSVIDDQTFLEDFAPDYRTALWTFLLPYQTLRNTLMTIAMATNSNPTTYDSVHANGAL